MDRLQQVEALIDEFGEMMEGCGDVEYSYLHRIRTALDEYAEVMRKIGPGNPRVGFKEKELKP